MPDCLLLGSSEEACGRSGRAPVALPGLWRQGTLSSLAPGTLVMSQLFLFKPVSLLAKMLINASRVVLRIKLEKYL